MTRRHPVDTAILTGLVIGHIAGAVAIARSLRAFTGWYRRNEI